MLNLCLQLLRSKASGPLTSVQFLDLSNLEIRKATTTTQHISPHHPGQYLNMFVKLNDILKISCLIYLAEGQFILCMFRLLCIDCDNKLKNKKNLKKMSLSGRDEYAMLEFLLFLYFSFQLALNVLEVVPGSNIWYFMAIIYSLLIT